MRARTFTPRTARRRRQPGASWAATRGHRLHLFGLVLLALVVNRVVRMVLGRPAPPASDEQLLSA